MFFKISKKMSNHQNKNKVQFNKKLFSIHRRFKSKKNQVFLVTAEFNSSKKPGNKSILKIFDDEFKDNIMTEITTLERLHALSIHVPNILEYTTDSLMLEYVSGDTFMQILDDVKNNNNHGEVDRQQPNLKKLFERLGEWFADLHFKTWEYTNQNNENLPEGQAYKTGTSMLKGDCVLKNFIYNTQSKTVCGVDFEESVRGAQVKDLGALCAAVLIVKPMFDDLNFALCNYFLNSYLLSITRLSQEKQVTKGMMIKDISVQSVSIATIDALNFAAKWVSKEHADTIKIWSERIKQKKFFDILKY